MSEPQSYTNHARFVPLYHFVLFPILGLNLVYAGYAATQLIPAGVYFQPIAGFLLALGLLIMFFFVRLTPLKVQDRLICLEERLRMQEVLPADQRSQISSLSVDQFVALRFASDAELPELVRTVLAEKITNKGEIKKRIKNWRADDRRC